MEKIGMIPVGLAMIGVMFDVLSLVYFLQTLFTRKFASGFPYIALFAYAAAALCAVPLVLLDIPGVSIPREKAVVLLAILVALAIAHGLLHWGHERLHRRLQ